MAATVARAGHAVARAREAAAEQKLRAAMEAARRKLHLVQRLERAEGARQEALMAVMAGQARRSSEGFLTREAVRRTQLRRRSSSRKLQAAWRAFCEHRQTTRGLAAAFVDTGVPFTVPLGQATLGSQAAAERCATAGATAEAKLEMPPLRSIAVPAGSPLPVAPVVGAGTFEHLAATLSARSTLNAAQALLQRLESRVTVKGVSTGCCAGLLRRLFPRVPPGCTTERYPPRIFLCAYMILGHPDVVFNKQGEREDALTFAGQDMLATFEALLARLADAPLAVDGPGAERTACAAADEEGMVLGEEERSAAMVASLAAMLQRFDETWVAYLEQFVAWKSADAAGLETDLIRAAVELERSRLAKLANGGSATPHRLRSPEDLQALGAAADHDLQLIAERVRRLTGTQGALRLQAALAAARAAAAAEATAREAAATAACDVEPHLPPAASLARSPSKSPIKKASRSHGAYGGESSGGSLDVVTPEPASQLSSVMLLGASPSSGALVAAALAPVDMEAALSQHPNLGLCWQLLYEPQWQMPTSELETAWGDALGRTDPKAEAPPSPEELAGIDMNAVAALTQRRIKRIAERAFWDAVQEKLGGGLSGGSGGAANMSGEAPAAASQVAALLAELGGQLAEVLPSGAAAEVTAALDAQALSHSLLAPGGGLDAPVLLRLLEWCGSLVAMHGAPARDADATAAQKLVRQQLAVAAGNVSATAAVATRALRLLTIQLKLLRADAANVHLHALSVQLQSEGAAAYATTKFEAMLGRAELYQEAQLSALLPHTRAWLADASGQLPHIEQGLVRMVSGEGIIGRLTVPETLRLDAMRLHAAQGDFQRLLVLTTCLLLVRQGAAAAGLPFGQSELAAAKRRLSAVLADPSMRMPELAAECAALAGGEADAGRERAVQDSIHRMLSRGSGAMKALTSGLTTALLALLLFGLETVHAQEQVSLALRRCGAGDLAGEAADLARQLANMAAISEAVCAQWYDALSRDLL
ncbi:T-complex 11 [Micractinium conductrix]|uniref:T-complex 11 n=1 Tax=Micractinium conductrix TaxID=554055 RepID=A0A2P6VK15_9CHLO|nr:T-complex 11 [Micractinium conductrix]|eukprot:PSC74446.1 T-complex 11 [Micractinium conductrix]